MAPLAGMLGSRLQTTQKARYKYYYYLSWGSLSFFLNSFGKKGCVYGVVSCRQPANFFVGKCEAARLHDDAAAIFADFFFPLSEMGQTKKDD